MVITVMLLSCKYNLDKIRIKGIIDIIRRSRSNKDVSSYYICVCILCPYIVKCMYVLWTDRAYCIICGVVGFYIKPHNTPHNTQDQNIPKSL